MAEIRVERKEGRGIWPWVLGILAALLVLWYLFGRNNDSETAGAIGPNSPTAQGPIADEPPSAAIRGTPVEAFTTFVGGAAPAGSETAQHTYTATGIRLLADALAGTTGGAADAELANMRKQADALTTSSDRSANHADMARSAFKSAAKVFASAETKREAGGKSRSATVKTAAEALEPGAPLLKQQARVQAFFEQARDALQSMSRAGA